MWRSVAPWVDRPPACPIHSPCWWTTFVGIRLNRYAALAVISRKVNVSSKATRPGHSLVFTMNALSSDQGKELIPHTIHNASSRSGQPVIKLNYAAIPFDLLESELFGHVIPPAPR